MNNFNKDEAEFNDNMILLKQKDLDEEDLLISVGVITREEVNKIKADVESLLKKY